MGQRGRIYAAGAGDLLSQILLITLPVTISCLSGA
jgi:hypothetical protein